MPYWEDPGDENKGLPTGPWIIIGITVVLIILALWLR